MNAYDSAKATEAEAMLDLIPYAESISHKVTLVGGQLWLQKHAGDIVVQMSPGAYYADVKAEAEDRYGTLYLETWSNLSRFTLGWMFTSQADDIWYYFVKERRLHKVALCRLRAWAFQQRRIYSYPEKCQKKREQANDTWGRCVPIAILSKEVEAFVTIDIGNLLPKRS